MGTSAYVVTSVDPHELTAEQLLSDLDGHAFVFTSKDRAAQAARSLAAENGVVHYVCKLEAVSIHKPRSR